MAQILTKKGAPLPYRLHSIGMPPTQHATMTCAQCGHVARFPYVNREIPHLICERFERMGWEIYRNAKARCPDCTRKRIRQKAAFARMETMQTTPTPKISLVKTEHPAITPAPRQVYLVVVDETGKPSIRPLARAQEMLFGETTYLVIPQEDLG